MMKTANNVTDERAQMVRDAESALRSAEGDAAREEHNDPGVIAARNKRAAAGALAREDCLAAIKKVYPLGTVVVAGRGFNGQWPPRAVVGYRFAYWGVKLVLENPKSKKWTEASACTTFTSVKLPVEKGEGG